MWRGLKVKRSHAVHTNSVNSGGLSPNRALRKHLTQSEMRRAARKPHLPVRIKLPPPPPPPLPPPRTMAMPLLPSSTSEPIVLED